MSADLPTHLAGLRRDRVGRPVPYINQWGPAEQTFRVSLRHDPHVDDVAVFYDEDPAGDPDFTRQSMQRQREIMVRGLCQVCAREVPWPDRKIAISPVTMHVIQWRGLDVAVLHEPWLCPDCADYATRHCPALIRRRRDEQLTVLDVASPDNCHFLVSRGWVAGPLRRRTQKRPVAMWVKVLLPSSVLRLKGKTP